MPTPYKLTKTTVNFPDRAPTKISVSVDLEASPAQVWKVLVDTPRWVEWCDGVTVAHDLGDSSKSSSSSSSTTTSVMQTVGSTRRIVVSGLEVLEEIIALDEDNKVWAFCVYESNVPLWKQLVERIVLEATESGGTRATYQLGAEFRLLGKLLKPLILYNTHAAWTKSLKGIDGHVQKCLQKSAVASQ